MRMASSSGTSAGSSGLQNSGSEKYQRQIMDQRKWKRMISNRESARRSRMRKQKHMVDLTARAMELEKKNGEIITRISVTTQHYLNVEAENSILRAQVTELSHRLEYLNQIISFCNVGNGLIAEPEQFGSFNLYNDQGGFINNSWNSLYANQPILASPDMFHY